MVADRFCFSWISLGRALVVPPVPQAPASLPRLLPLARHTQRSLHAVGSLSQVKRRRKGRFSRRRPTDGHSRFVSVELDQAAELPAKILFPTERNLTVPAACGIDTLTSEGASRADGFSFCWCRKLREPPRLM